MYSEFGKNKLNCEQTLNTFNKPSGAALLLSWILNNESECPRLKFRLRQAIFGFLEVTKLTNWLRKTLKTPTFVISLKNYDTESSLLEHALVTFVPVILFFISRVFVLCALAWLFFCVMTVIFLKVFVMSLKIVQNFFCFFWYFQLLALKKLHFTSMHRQSQLRQFKDQIETFQSEKSTVHLSSLFVEDSTILNCYTYFWKKDSDLTDHKL